MEDDTQAAGWPAAPEFDWRGGAKEKRGTECERSLNERHNFFRSARWCHDASSILTTAEDRLLRVYDCKYADDSVEFATPRSFSQPDSINAATWYPSASTTTPETYCFVTSVRDTPVRLVDATDGRIRASYPIIDHRERFVSPHCLTFNPTGTKVYGGHENAIEVLDIANPGPDTSERLKTTSTRKERDVPASCPLNDSVDTQAHLAGIISFLAFCTDYSGTYAAGSFSGSVAIYSEDTAATAVAHLDGVHPGGVTHLAFHPLSPQTLFVGSRRSPSIQVFDLRDTSTPVGELVRKSETNQRLSFDVDPWGRWLAGGDDDGKVKVWDITELDKPAVFEDKLHDDAVGSVQLHPFRPLLLSVGGSRAYLQTDPAQDLESDSDGDYDSDDSDTSDPGPASTNIDGADGKIGNPTHSNEDDPGVETPVPKITATAISATHSSQTSFRPQAGRKETSLRIWSFA